MKGEIPISILSRYFRVPYKDGIAIDYPGRDMLLKSRITNLSSNGVFVTTRNPLPRGSVFDVTFTVPGQDKPMTATCIVRWSTEVEGALADLRRGTRGMGLEFVKIQKKDKKALERYIKEFLSRMRKNVGAGEDA